MFATDNIRNDEAYEKWWIFRVKYLKSNPFEKVMLPIGNCIAYTLQLLFGQRREMEKWKKN